MKRNKYIPQIEISTERISEFGIKNINNKYEVIKKVSKKLKEKYLSTEKQSKPIINVNTGMIVEVWKNGINETFGNDKYYNNLSENMKLAKIASIYSLAKLIKYGKVRSKEAENYHNKNSKVKYAYLISHIIIDNDKYNVTIDIRKLASGETKFYIHNLSLIKETNLS